ncbi:MAG: 16S rRNA (cytidine(1402)-2'-O)-methyltransferase, partial [Bacilli bacterium]
MPKGILYVVATPIGNLSEMTPRAIDTLRQVSLIACEDTRETMKLTSHFDIATPLMSCHEHNERSVVLKLVERLDQGDDVAIVSDAGYPGISDPGAHVIHTCIRHGIQVVVISGACALINALVGSGLDTDHFYFHGFLPVKQGDRRKALAELSSRPETIIFYEAPHRIEDTLLDLQTEFGNRNACVCRELTKKFETYHRGTLEQLQLLLFANPPRGELVLIVEGKAREPRVTLSNVEIMRSVQELIDQGMT